tara:strand:+ start:473 stop:2395 length:1923 start_codon:yes stop_codon:yes gene_type:complete
MYRRPPDWALSAIPLAFLAILFAAPLFDRPFVWGINHLRYFGSPVWLTCALLLLAAAIPVVRERVFSFSLPMVKVKIHLPLLVAASGLVFYLLRDTTHLLGDGYLLTRELTHGFRKIANEPLSIWVLFRLKDLLMSLDVQAGQLYTAWSILSGCAYVALSILVARRLTDRSPNAITLSLFLLTPAYMGLFFGYHETYPLLYPLLLLYVLFAFEVAEGKAHPVLPGLVMGLMAVLHFTMLTLLPSLAYVWRSRSARTDGGSAGALIWGLPGLALAAGALWLTGFRLDTYFSHTANETLLPLWSEGDHSIPYGALSVPHAVEFLNQCLLVYLPSLLVIPFASRSFVQSERSIFLLTAVVPAFVVTFFGFTVIGAFRDWDALAFPGLFTTFWAGLAMSNSEDRIRPAAIVVLTVAAVNTLLWVNVNANPERATQRFEDGLNLSALSPRARSFGWETLGAYYSKLGDMGQASRAYERASQSDPKHPRYPNLLGFAQMQRGAYADAVVSFRRATDLDPSRYDAHLNLGLSLLQIGDPAGALEAIGRARVLRPDLGRIHFALGVAQYGANNPRGAIEAYLRCLEIEPDNVTAHLNVSHLYGELTENDKKRIHLERVLTLAPHHPQRDEIGSWLAWYARQSGETTDP